MSSLYRILKSNKSVVMIILITFVISVSFLCSACSHAFKPVDTSVTPDGSASDSEIDEEIDPDQEIYDLIGSLSIEEKIAQLFIVSPEQLTPDYSCVIAAGDVTNAAINEYPVGGIIYFSQNLVDPGQTKEMLSNVQEYSWNRIGLPMFTCIDEEGGQIVRLASNKAFDLPTFDNMNLIGSTGDTDKAYELGSTIGKYLYDLGFNVDFAPVADVLTNSENTVVKKRAFGTEPEIVMKMADAVSRGFASENILYSYKHFPGHGDTTADTHDGYAFSNKTKEELYECELKPFINGIEDDVPFIMVGHMAFPNITGDNTFASLSEVIINDILLDELGFKGIVITDAFNMGAITKEYSSAEVAVKAINSGVDMILMPENFFEAYDGLVEAVKDGRVSEDRINRSVFKVIKAKRDYNLIK